VDKHKNSTAFSVQHVFLTHDALVGPDAAKLFTQWWTMVVTSNMSKEERNAAIDETLKDWFGLACPTYANLENNRLNKVIQIGDKWEIYDNEDLGKFIKFHFKNIECSYGNTNSKKSFEVMLSIIGNRICNAILTWKDLKDYSSVLAEIARLQQELKEIFLSDTNHRDLISRAMKSISSTVSSPTSVGSVQLLNNLSSLLVEKQRENGVRVGNETTFYKDVYTFLKIICTWSGSIVELYNISQKKGCSIVPNQQKDNKSYSDSKSPTNGGNTNPFKGSNGNSNHFKGSNGEVHKGSTRDGIVSKTPSDISKVTKPYQIDKSLYDPSPCNSCGRLHKIGYTKCECPNHPDINSSLNTWESSIMGMKYKSLGYDWIRTYHRLNGDKSDFIKYYAKSTKGNNNIHSKLFNLNDVNPNSFLSIFSFRNLKDGSMIQCNTLIDSGAVESNFMSIEASEVLQKAGYKMKSFYTKVDMGVKGLTQNIIGKFKNLEISFYNFVTNLRKI